MRVSGSGRVTGSGNFGRTQEIERVPIRSFRYSGEICTRQPRRVMTDCVTPSHTGPGAVPSAFPRSFRMQLPQNLKFRDAALSRAFAGKGRIPMSTFVERYIDGSIEVAGDLHDFLRARSEWANYRFTWDQAKFLITRFLPSVLIHSKAADKKFVVGHYDRGNDFFEAFLGPSMVYTSAVFDRADEPLEAAQERKIRRVADRLQLKRGDRLLDIGCGWGTLALTLAADRGVDATGVTLSSKQAQFGTARIQERKVADRVRILTLDYRDIPATRFDKISCLEMAEHVGVRNFQRFLRQVSGLPEYDGLFFLQIGALRRPPEALVVRNDRGGYWIAAYGERWYRLWHLFLAWSVFTGEQGRGDCMQIVAHKSRPSFDRARFVGKA